ncbi:hypothetical protein BACI349Y_540085 [Bacillus sp. 349Y]|nr:hypothetical protein BACI349Y_540085 [Bacillus sp. 349Y]
MGVLAYDLEPQPAGARHHEKRRRVALRRQALDKTTGKAPFAFLGVLTYDLQPQPAAARHHEKRRRVALRVQA